MVSCVKFKSDCWRKFESLWLHPIDFIIDVYSLVHIHLPIAVTFKSNIEGNWCAPTSQKTINHLNKWMAHVEQTSQIVWPSKWMWKELEYTCWNTNQWTLIEGMENTDCYELSLLFINNNANVSTEPKYKSS